MAMTLQFTCFYFTDALYHFLLVADAYTSSNCPNNASGSFWHPWLYPYPSLLYRNMNHLCCLLFFLECENGDIRPKTAVSPTEADPKFFSNVQNDAIKIIQKEKIQEEYRKVRFPIITTELHGGGSQWMKGALRHIIFPLVDCHTEVLVDVECLQISGLLLNKSMQNLFHLLIQIQITC